MMYIGSLTTKINIYLGVGSGREVVRRPYSMLNKQLTKEGSSQLESETYLSWTNYPISA